MIVMMIVMMMMMIVMMMMMMMITYGSNFVILPCSHYIRLQFTHYCYNPIMPLSFFTMSTGGGELFFHLKKKGIILEKEVKFYLGR